MADMSSMKPAFTETMQIGIVVPDLEAAIRTYEEVYGIGPWNRFTVGPEMIEGEVMVRGKPVDWRGKAAATMVAGVMWELIEPHDKDDLFGRFLASRGGVGGVHHVAVKTPDFNGLRRQQAERGQEPLMRGRFSGIDIDYLDTERDLGVILEVFSGLPG